MEVPNRNRQSSTFSDDMEPYLHRDDFTYGPQGDLDFPSSRNSSISFDRPSTSRVHGRSLSIVSVASRRDGARAATLYPAASPAFPDSPFGGSAYAEALNEDDDGDDDIELRGIGRGLSKDITETGRRPYRKTFQPLVAQEMWWMAASAMAVLALTVAAIVLCFVG